jgi:hypothetical protein
VLPEPTQTGPKKKKKKKKKKKQIVSGHPRLLRVHVRDISTRLVLWLGSRYNLDGMTYSKIGA